MNKFVFEFLELSITSVIDRESVLVIIMSVIMRHMYNYWKIWIINEITYSMNDGLKLVVDEFWQRNQRLPRTNGNPENPAKPFVLPLVSAPRLTYNK